MLRRVRKIKDDNILILNYSKFKLNDNAHYITYEETKRHCIDIKDINLKRSYDETGNTTKIKYDIDTFDEIYIYNRTENDSSKNYLFLTSFLSRVEKKGYKYNIIPDKDEVNNLHDNQGHRMNWKISELLSAEDFDGGKITQLQDKINKLEDTKAEKIAVEKFFIKLRLGVDKLNTEILQAYHYKYQRLTYFLSLLDADNTPYNNDNQYDELIFQRPIIKDLINKLGFKNMFDLNTKYNKEQFSDKINAMENTNIFTHNIVYYKSFSTSKKHLANIFTKDTSIEDTSLKCKLGYINRCLSKFGLTIDIDRVREGSGNLKSYYHLGHLNNISEIIEYKIQKGMNYYDEECILEKPKTYVYKDLFIEDKNRKPGRREGSYDQGAKHEDDIFIDDSITDDIFIDDNITDDIFLDDDISIDDNTTNKDIFIDDDIFTADSCTSDQEYKKPLDVAITTYNEFKDQTVMKQFDMKMEELRNSGELEKDMKKRREENHLRELNSKKVTRQSAAYIRKWKTTTEKIHMEELAIFSKLNITKFLTIYDRNEIDFFMEDVKDLIQEGKEIIKEARRKLHGRYLKHKTIIK